jgi:TRAP transporter TAXI family solute receptor
MAMSRTLRLMTIFFVCALFVMPINEVGAQKASPLPSRIVLSGGSTVSTSYAYATAFAKVATSHTPMLVVAQSTAGPAAYVKMISDTGKPQFGWMGGVDTWQAYVGKFVSEPVPGLPDIDVPYPLSRNIRIVLATPPMKNGLIVREDAPMKKVSDMKGKRMGWEFAGYVPNVASTLCYLLAAGLTIKDVVPVKVSSLKAGVDALVEGRLDATTSSTGMPATTEANAKIGVRHLAQDVASPEWLRKAQIVQPGSFVDVAKAGEGASIKEDTPLWAKPGYIISSTHVSDAVVYAFLEALWNNYKETWPIHRTLARGFRQKSFIDDIFPIPVHTGAIKFFKEKALWTPEREKRNSDWLKK